MILALLTLVPIPASADLTAEQIETIQLITQKNSAYFASLPEDIAMKFQFIISPDFHLSYEWRFSAGRFYPRAQSESGDRGVNLLAFDGERYQAQSGNWLHVAKNKSHMQSNITSMWVTNPLTTMFLFTNPSDQLEGPSFLKQRASWRDAETRVIGFETDKVGGQNCFRIMYKMTDGRVAMTFDPSLNYYPIRVQVFNSRNEETGDCQVTKFFEIDNHGQKVMIPSLISAKSPKAPEAHDYCVLDEKSVSLNRITNLKAFRIPRSAAVHIWDADLKAEIK